MPPGTGGTGHHDKYHQFSSKSHQSPISTINWVGDSPKTAGHFNNFRSICMEEFALKKRLPWNSPLFRYHSAIWAAAPYSWEFCHTTVPYAISNMRELLDTSTSLNWFCIANGFHFSWHFILHAGIVWYQILIPVSCITYIYIDAAFICLRLTLLGKRILKKRATTLSKKASRACWETMSDK